MDRPSRNRISVNYSDFQDNDDEDFAAVKPPFKKSRTSSKDPDSERNPTTSSVVVDLTGSGQRKRVSLEDKLYERDLEAALTLSLLDPSVRGGEPATKAEALDGSEAPPPVLSHCNEANRHLDEQQLRPDSPPVLSNCSVDGNSLGLNLIINMKTSPPSVSKQKKVSEQERNTLKEKNIEDIDYQPQNTPESESDANFTEEEESEDETFTVKKKKNVKKLGRNIEKKTPQTAKQKKEKEEKTPAKASKVKNSASTPIINRSPAASVSASALKIPTSPSLSKPSLSSSPAGGKVQKWNPPGLVGRSSSASQDAPVKSPVQGLRLGLSRLARVKPLHPNGPAH